MNITLPTFIAIGRKQGRANLHIIEPGFQMCYLRFGKRYIGGDSFDPVIDIANIEVEDKLKRTGVLTRFIQKIKTTYPELTILMECVNPVLNKPLERMGFTVDPSTKYYSFSRNYFLPATVALKEKPWPIASDSITP